MYQFIYPPTIRFSHLYQRPQQLMSAFAKLGNVATFYCVDRNVQTVQPTPNFSAVARDTKYEPINDNPIVLWVSHPVSALKDLEKYPHHISVFDAIDIPKEEFRSWKNNYEIISEHADIVFTTSDALYDINSKHSKNVHMLPNAADFNFLTTRLRMSPLLRSIKLLRKPIIMYVGAVASWLDWELIDNVAQSCSGYEFVFIGPLYEINKDRIPNRSNIHHIDQQPYDTLPMFTHYADAFINPFLINEMTIGVDPIKIYEYMSVGRPIVSTPLPELYKYSDCIYLAANARDFSSHIKLAITNPPIHYHRYKEIARNNSWTHRARYAMEVLNQIPIQGYKEYQFPQKGRKVTSVKPRNWRRI